MDNLFNIDVCSIFEQYTIKEIEALNLKIQHEVDGKKEELRNMVGERYRDLIQAADTITEMKFTSEKIENVISKNEIMNWKSNNREQEIIKEQCFNDEVFEVTKQIKILINLNELISTSIDECNFLTATQLFLLSRHLNASLKLDSNSDVIRKFPVARKVWDLLSPFYSSIKSHCLKALEDQNIDLEKTVDCLGSLILLENGQFTSSLSTFVQIRVKTFLKILTDSDKSYELVKDKLITSVMELVNSTKIVYEAFVNYNGSDGLLIQKLTSLNSENVSLPSSLIAKNPFLATIKLVNKFKSRCNPGLLDKELVRNAMAQWMNSVESIAQNQLKDVVKYIVSIDIIREMENQVQNITKPPNWSDMSESLFGMEHLDFYEKLYQPLILERIYSIINISWDNIQNNFKNEIEKLTGIINDRVHRDMKHYVWINDDSDNPQSLKDALNVEQKTHNLLMKVNGYNKHIVEICSKLDMNLKKLIDDLKNYILAKIYVQKALRMKECQVPNQEKMLLYLKDSSKDNISALIKYIKSSVLLNDTENCHLLARLLQAISEMCPNLKHCFSNNLLTEHRVYYTESSLSSQDSDHWKEVSDMLTNDSIQLWKVWLHGFIAQWNELKFENELTAYALLKEFPTWRCLTINEKGENNQNIESKIFIPQQLSIGTQCWIFNIISCLNKIIPHTLPKQIHLEIVEEFNIKLFNYYSSLCQQKELISNQKIAWQILFDLKVLIGLFAVRENKSKNDEFQELINECKTIIDPFDFDVFYPHIINNIKDNTSRLQYELGCMIPYSNYNSSVLQSQNIVHIHDTEPNIISMSVSQAEKRWIPLLPIIKTKTFPSELSKEKIKLQQPLQPVKKALPVSASSSTLSSLQEWFK
ncbi:hypothetical protein ACKWTF_007408 [Chironomus riparius]